MKSKLLILSEAYPSKESPYSMSFVHSRTIEYLKLGVEVEVINFSTKVNYQFEGVDVYAPSNHLKIAEYSAIISHAPNIKNHITFLIRNIRKIERLIFVFHGHEVLPLKKYYPPAYKWNQKKSSMLKDAIQSTYDTIKLLILRSFINTFNKKIRIIYVSNWMKTEAEKWIGKNIGIKKYIINNPINPAFAVQQYTANKASPLDFVSIRPLDDPKYCIDLIVELARSNPKYNFSIYGKGKYFIANERPSNVFWHDQFILQKDIPDILNNFKVALMPTRLDAQGVMVCEMACFGIPVITSDIPVCHEMLDCFNNVYFIDNCDNAFPLDTAFRHTSNSEKCKCRFDPCLIAKTELDTFLDA